MSFILLFLVGAVTLAVAGAKAHANRVRSAWTQAAQELGLVPTLGGLFSKPHLAGRIDGLDVLVDVYTTGGENNTSYTRYRVLHKPIGPPVTLKRQGTFSFMRKLIGGRDVEIGDMHFDGAVIVDATDPAAVAAFLTPARRAAVLQIFETFRGAEFTHNSITIERVKVETDSKRLVRTMYRLVDTAHVMADSTDVDQALEKQDRGELSAAASDLAAINRRGPNSFSQLLEAETLVELGDHDGAGRVLDRVGDRLAGDPVYEGWKAVAERPPPPPPLQLWRSTLPPPPSGPIPPPVGSAGLLPEPEAVPESIEPAAIPESEAPAPELPLSDLDQQSVIDELFDRGRLSFEVVDYFETACAGKRVAWSGEVTASSRDRNDPDFGGSPGTKVTLILGTSGRSDLVSNQVYAVVVMGDGVPAQRGDHMGFDGVLVRVDRFARQIHVAGGVPTTS